MKRMLPKFTATRATDSPEEVMTTETEVSPATWWREKVLELREMADRTGDLDFQPGTLRSCWPLGVQTQEG
jgi:hypothetical protein